MEDKAREQAESDAKAIAKAQESHRLALEKAEKEKEEMLKNEKNSFNEAQEKYRIELAGQRTRLVEKHKVLLFVCFEINNMNILLYFKL